MTFRLFGSILILVGCSGMGLSIVHQLKREEAMLRQIVLALEYMTSELQYHRIVLPDLLRSGSRAASGELRRLLEAFAAELEKQVYEDASVCMKHFLTEQKALPDRVRSVLELMAASIGIFDLNGQLKGFESALVACRKELRYMEANRDERVRSYHTLFFCAGAALAILLF